MRLVAFFLVHTFWMNFYLGVFDMQMGDVHSSMSVAEQHNYARCFTITITCGVVGIPIIGVLMDRSERRGRRERH